MNPKIIIMKFVFFIAVLCIISCSGRQETDFVIRPETKFFNAVALNDIPLNPPSQGEWRHSHNEPVQTFDQYKNSVPVRPSVNRQIIYLRPYGNFSGEGQKILNYTAEYLEIFYQLKVAVQHPFSDKVIPESARRTRGDGTEQLLAPYFIDKLLRQDMPPDAIVVMAVTEKDIYPKADWNFVFGLASYHERIAVCSIKRLYRNLSDSIDFRRCLLRLIAISSHEIGHMFGLSHCVTASCVMNGSNSLEETDMQPNRLCSSCLKKLYWDVRFDNKKRLRELQGYFYAHGLERDYLLAKLDCERIK